MQSREERQHFSSDARERPLAVVPLAMLPEGVAAGDILSLSFHAEPELTEEARTRVLALHEKLLRK